MDSPATNYELSTPCHLYGRHTYLTSSVNSILAEIASSYD